MTHIPRSRYLLLEWVQQGQPIMEHPADTLSLTGGSCPSTGSDNNKTLPPVFTGVWWTHGIEAIAEQAELFFPAYKQAGGELNELVADWEAAMFGPSSCPLPENATEAGLAATVACAACAREKWAAIEGDHRFPAILTELKPLGFEMDGSLADTMIRYQCVASPDAALRPGGLADCSQLDGLGEEQRNRIARTQASVCRCSISACHAIMLRCSSPSPSNREQSARPPGRSAGSSEATHW